MPERRGRDGLDGLDGASAYEIAKAFGFRGTAQEWLTSLQGPPGRDGESVPVESVRAMVMEALAALPVARDGADGRDGKDGADGRDGKPGPRGPRGERGKDAAVAPVESWRADYYRDKVTKLVTRVRAQAASGTGLAINLYPVRGADDLIDYIDLIPEPA